jgi:hypothetical protein
MNNISSIYYEKQWSKSKQNHNSWENPNNVMMNHHVFNIDRKKSLVFAITSQQALVGLYDSMGKTNLNYVFCSLSVFPIRVSFTKKSRKNDQKSFHLFQILDF